jgi:glutamate/tyrosine decarboxylase-like PLP-dependent enzyme
MFTYDDRMTGLILDYCRARLDHDSVPLDFGGTHPPAPDALEGLLREEGNDPEDVLNIFAHILAPAILSCDSSRYLALIPAAPTKASLLFDMVVSCSSFPGTSWLEAAGVVTAENQALRLLADLAGLPSQAGGCFVSGGSAANLSALVVARDTAATRRGGTAPLRPRIAVSAEVHASVIAALHIIGVDPLLVPTDDHRLTARSLRSALHADPGGEEVIGVVATAGTTNAGLIDDLHGVGEVARQNRLWFHVDGAYGAAALLAPSTRDHFHGLEFADSFVVDPHKWLFAPYDCAALLYRDPAAAKAVHTQDASYLEVLHPDVPDEWNPGDYAFHLTRRARGLPFWFSLAVNGIRAYREAVEAVLAITRRSADLIADTPHLELVRRPELSVVLFRRTGWGREDYRAWSARLLAEQRAFVTPTTWEGQPTARLAFIHPDTTLDVVQEICDAMA